MSDLDEFKRKIDGLADILVTKTHEQRIAFLNEAFSGMSPEQVSLYRSIVTVETLRRESDFRDPQTPQMPEAPTLNPLSILREAVKRVPSLKYAFGLVGIVCVIAITAALNVDFKIAVYGTVVIIFLMVALLVFARLAALAPGKFLLPALVFLWGAVILTILTAVCLFTSAFFRYPIDFDGKEHHEANAEPNPPVPAAVFATDFLGLLDAEKYDQAYFDLADNLKQQADEVGFINGMKQNRGWRGTFVGRTTVSTQAVQPPNFPKGIYTQIVYASNFLKSNQTTETLILSVINGQWRVYSYYIWPPTETASPPTRAVIPPPLPAPIHRKVLIFGDHFDQSKVYIVTGAPDYDLGQGDDHNQKYISRCCKGPNQVLPISWSQLLDKPRFFAPVPPPPSLPLPYRSGPYSIEGMRTAVYDSHIAIQPSTEGLPEVSQDVATKYDDERWWIFDVDVQP